MPALGVSFAAQPGNESASAPSEDLAEAERLSEEIAKLYRAGRFPEAISLAERALAIREKTLGPEHPDTVTNVNNLAVLYQSMGVYAKAEPLLQRALATSEKQLGPDHPDTAAQLNNLATLYYSIGAYVKAESLFQRALAIREKALGPDDPDTAVSINNLATLYLSMGANTKAAQLYERALAIMEKALGPEDRLIATALNNLASVYSSMGAYAKAEPLNERAVAIMEKTLGPEHPDTATGLNNLAEMYSAMSSYDKAEPLYQRALAIRERALGPEHPDTGVSLNNLARMYESAGRYSSAEPLYQRALAVMEKALGPDHPRTATSVNNLANLYQSMGAYDKAESLSERAQAIDERNAARVLLTGSEARKRAYLQQGRGHIDAAVSFSLSHPTARSRASGLTAVLQYKGRVLDAMSDSVARLRRSVEPRDQSLFDQLSDVERKLSSLTFGGSGKPSGTAYRERLAALTQDEERLQAELSTRSAAFREEAAPITLEGVRQALPADATLVEWFRYGPFDPKATGPASAHWGAPRYVAYVLNRTGEPVAIDLGTAEPIDALVAEFRTALSDPTTTYFTEVAADLSEKLIKPLGPQLKPGQHLLFSPDGELNLLPFAALADESGDYLMQRLEITYLTSGRDLLRMGADPAARDGAVVMADPDFGQVASEGSSVDAVVASTRSADLDRSGLIFKRLAGTADEAKALRSLLKLDAQHTPTGDRATEALLRALHGPRILHVATHGFFLSDREAAAIPKPAGFAENTRTPSGENPLLRSGLALAGANARRSGDTDDGILTAAEAAQLDLLGTQLVVLSACETGVGKVRTGEGVYGLRRALVLAGAQAQVASLWKVDDSATQELIVNYYRRLLSGQGRSAALRAAQQAMLANPQRQHPYYWAAFIPIGNWTTLPPGHLKELNRAN
jgi:CHAT domain-containing protein/Tfp pilus assembly protein PilF